jgi:hypothetical protein
MIWFVFYLGVSKRAAVGKTTPDLENRHHPMYCQEVKFCYPSDWDVMVAVGILKTFQSPLETITDLQYKLQLDL